MKPRVLVIGLDCAEPELVFGVLRSRLPNLSQLMATGVYGRLESCTPPITVPAWAVMMTGRDPGELGLYGFRNRVKGTYREGRLVGTGAVRFRRVWDVLSDNGRPVVVLGVPPSYPVYPLNGAMVGCFLTPALNREAYYPASLRHTLESGYHFDVSEYRTDHKDKLRAELWQMTTEHFALARSLIRSQPWDFFMMVEIGVDRVHHGFWRFYDTSHRHYPGPNPYSTVIPEYYELVDREIGELLQHIDEDTSIFVVSDHGVKRMDGAIAINQWLISQGLLKLASSPSGPMDLEQCDVDWANTVAWASGGYYARMYVNVKGREPQGIVLPERYDNVCEEIGVLLSHLTDDAGKPMPVKVLRPRDIYRATEGVPPDLMVFLGDLHWRAASKVGLERIHLLDNDTGADDANHARHGLYIIKQPRDDARGPGAVLPIDSIARRILDAAGEERSFP